MTTTADEIARRVGLVPPTEWHAEHGDLPGYTTTMLLNVVAALADGWECKVSASTIKDARRLVSRAVGIAADANVHLRPYCLEPIPVERGISMQAAGAFDSEGTKCAWFQDHYRPRAPGMSGRTLDPDLIRVSSTEPERREGYEWVVRPFARLDGVRANRAIIADDVECTKAFEDWWLAEVRSRVRPRCLPLGQAESMARFAAPPVDPFRATRRTRQVSIPVRDPAADPNDPAAGWSFHDETIHEERVWVEGSGRFLTNKWQRVEQP